MLLCQKCDHMCWDNLTDDFTSPTIRISSVSILCITRYKAELIAFDTSSGTSFIINIPEGFVYPFLCEKGGLTTFFFSIVFTITSKYNY